MDFKFSFLLVFVFRLRQRKETGICVFCFLQIMMRKIFNFQMLDTMGITMEFLHPQELARLKCVQRAGSNLAGAATIALDTRLQILERVRLNVIHVYMSPEIQRLEFSACELLCTLSTEMHIIHEYQKYVIGKWINDPNEIISIFATEYINHYIMGKKSFYRFSVDESFLTNIAMYLYH